MEYILRVKAVSECMGIRRANLSYYLYKDQEIDLKDSGHPMNKFSNLIIKGNKVTNNNETLELVLGEDIFFYRLNDVKSLNTTVKERITLGVMLFPLDKQMEKYYVDAINDNTFFDQWNGEFEYLLGMMYELCEKNMVDAEEWYSKAKSKGFTFILNK